MVKGKDVIDWSQPIYSNGRRMVPSDSTQPANFHSLMFEDDPRCERWYYNKDGKPFAKNPHPITNVSPQRELGLPDPDVETMEASPQWGSF